MCQRKFECLAILGACFKNSGTIVFSFFLPIGRRSISFFDRVCSDFFVVVDVNINERLDSNKRRSSEQDDQKHDRHRLGQIEIPDLHDLDQTIQNQLCQQKHQQRANKVKNSKNNIFPLAVCTNCPNTDYVFATQCVKNEPQCRNKNDQRYQFDARTKLLQNGVNEP
jgi:hypothetical protein